MVKLLQGASAGVRAVASIWERIMAGPPRRILLVLGWDVGDDPEALWAAALLISGGVALVLTAVWLLCQWSCCSAAERRRMRQRADAAGPPPVDSKGTPLDELWTIHNKRYDMRSFVAAHPGGAGAIRLGMGRNCTELYESYHSLANEKLVASTLARYYVEDAPVGARDHETRFKWKTTPVYDRLKQKVRAHFAAQRGSVGAALSPGHRASAWQWLQLLVFIGASALALRSFTRGEMLGLVALPFCYWWGPSPCMHDGGHFSLARRPWLNEMFAHIGGAHMSQFSWQHQHTIGHHVHTNIAGWDPDLYHFNLAADNGLPGFRTSLSERTLPEKTGSCSRERWWRVGLKLRVPFTTFGPSIIWDVMSLIKPFGGAFLGLVPYVDISERELTFHSIGRCIVIWMAVVHPITISLVTATSWIRGAAVCVPFVLFPYAVHGCLFYMFSQVSHIQEECFHETKDADDPKHLHSHPLDRPATQRRHMQDAMAAVCAAEPALSQWQVQVKARDMLVQQAMATHVEETNPAHVVAAGGDGSGSVTVRRRKTEQEGEKEEEVEEWAVHQMDHALDYATESRFWLHVSNGLNLQVVHHLFPQVGWGHHMELSPIIAEVCAEFGITYNVKPTFWAAMSAHLAHLTNVNDTKAQGSVWVKPEIGVRTSVQTLTVLDQLDALADGSTAHRGQRAVFN